MCKLTYMGTSQKKSARGSASTVVTYFCAQLEGEQTKQKLHTDTNKRRGRTRMDRFACDGWLFITIVHNNNTRIRVRMTHSEAHVHYTDIAISEKIQNIIIEMKNSTPSVVSPLYPSSEIPGWHNYKRYGIEFFASTALLSLPRSKYMITGRALIRMCGS